MSRIKAPGYLREAIKKAEVQIAEQIRATLNEAVGPLAASVADNEKRQHAPMGCGHPLSCWGDWGEPDEPDAGAQCCWCADVARAKEQADEQRRFKEQADRALIDAVKRVRSPLPRGGYLAGALAKVEDKITARVREAIADACREDQTLEHHNTAIHDATRGSVGDAQEAVIAAAREGVVYDICSIWEGAWAMRVLEAETTAGKAKRVRCAEIVGDAIEEWTADTRSRSRATRVMQHAVARIMCTDDNPDTP